jgi:hypothetical protein
MDMAEQARNRNDHILPQGYLDGFTGPDGFLQVYDISAQKWAFRSNTKNVACERNFYEYSKDVNPDQTADEAFQEYEDFFPDLRRELVAPNFVGWKTHLPFLLCYINQIRVRSRLFRQHVLQTICPFSWPFLLACCERRMERLDRRCPISSFFSTPRAWMFRLR